MRAGPSSAVPIESHLQAIRTLQVSRCKRSQGTNNSGSPLAAAWGAKGPQRKPVTSRAAATPLDSAPDSERVSKLRGGVQSSDWLPIVCSHNVVPSAAEPPRALPWREGITDRMLVSSTSDFSGSDSAGASGSGSVTRNSISHPYPHSDNTAYDPPIRIDLDAPYSSPHMGPVGDFSSIVSRWLEGGSASLRSWLLQALQGTPTEGFTPQQQPNPDQRDRQVNASGSGPILEPELPKQLRRLQNVQQHDSLPSDNRGQTTAAADTGLDAVGDTGSALETRRTDVDTGAGADEGNGRSVPHWNGIAANSARAGATAANGKAGINIAAHNHGTAIRAASVAVHVLDMFALEPYSEEEALDDDDVELPDPGYAVHDGAAALYQRIPAPWDVQTFGLALGEEREGTAIRGAVRLEPRPIRRLRPLSGGGVSSAQMVSSSGADALAGDHATASTHSTVGAVSAAGTPGAVASASAAMRLTRQLSDAYNWRRVAALVSDHDGHLDLIHLSAALVRLAKLHRENASALVSVRWAEEEAEGWCEDTAGSEDGFGGSSEAAGGPERRQHQHGVSSSHGHAVSPGSGQCSSDRLEEQQQLHPDVATLVHSLLARLPRLMPRAKHRTVSNILWALGVLQPLFVTTRVAGSGNSGGGQMRSNMAAPVSVSAAAPQPSCLSQSAALLAAKMRHFWRDADLSPQTLALVLWGCARVGLRPGPTWAAEFSAASAPLLMRFTARELSYSLWALATLRLRPDSSWLVEARRALVAALAPNTRSAASTHARSCQRQRERTSMATAAAASAIRDPGAPCQAKEAEGTEDPHQQQPVVNMQILATMLWACAVLSVRLDAPDEEAVLSALTVRLRHEQSAIGTQALSMSLWGCARLGLRPQREFVTAWRAAASGPVLAAAPARALSCMLWSLARLRRPPPGPWVSECTGALLARAREGTVGRQAACNALFALASMDSKVSGEWLRGFTAATAPLLASLAPSVLGVVMHSLVRLAGGGGGRRDAGGDGGDCGSCTAEVFLAAANAAAVAALPTTSPRDIVGIVCSLQKLSDGAVSRQLYGMFVRRMAHMLRAGELTPRHAAACLACMAALVRRNRQHCNANSCDSEAVAIQHPHHRDMHDSHTVSEHLGHPHPHPRQHAPHNSVTCTTSTSDSYDVRHRPLPPRSFVGALLRCAISGDPTASGQMYDVGTALCAAADLGYVAHGPAARRAVAAAAVRACVRSPCARAVLVLLRGLYRLRVTPSAAWLSEVCQRAGSTTWRKLMSQEVEELVRLLWVLGGEAADTQRVQHDRESATMVEKLTHAEDRGSCSGADSSSSRHNAATMVSTNSTTAALSELQAQKNASGRGAAAPPIHPAASAAGGGDGRVMIAAPPSSGPLQALTTKPPPSAVSVLLAAAQASLAASPIQSLLSLAAGLVATTSGTSGPPAHPGPAPAQADAGSSSALHLGTDNPTVSEDPDSTPPPQLPLAPRDVPLPAVPLSSLLPSNWLQSLEAATASKLALPCVSAATLVELLACFACLGHRPSATWAEAWYDSTAARLPTLRPMHLCMALQLQGRLGLTPPRVWMAAHASALAAAAQQLPPLDVLAAVAELQRLGCDMDMGTAAVGTKLVYASDGTDEKEAEKPGNNVIMSPKGVASVKDLTTGKATAVAAVESAIAVSTLTSACVASAPGARVRSATCAPPVMTSLSGLVAAASTQLHQQLLTADPAAQLSVLAALQSLADPRVPSAPHSEGWVVGVLAMAHSVILQRPLHELLAALHLTTSTSFSLSLAVTEPETEPAAAVPPPATYKPPTAALSPPPSTQSSSSSGSVTSPASVNTRPISPSSSVVLLLASLARWDQAPSSRWLSCLARHIAGHTDSPNICWSPADTARVVCCMAALRYVPAADVAVRLQVQQLPGLAAGELPADIAAELCAAWAAVRRPPSAAWWLAAESAALAPPALATLTPTTLIRLPVNMAQLGHVPSYEWFVSYLALVPPALLCQPPPAYRTTPIVHADDLANLAWALGSAVHEGGYTHEIVSSSGALQALLRGVLSVLGSMGPRQLVLLVEGLARCRHELPVEWVGAFAGQVTRQLPACGPPELVSILYCLAFLRARPPLPWLAATLHRTAQLLPALLVSEQAYRVHDLMWAVTQLDPLGDLSISFLELLNSHRAVVMAAAPPLSSPYGHLGGLHAAMGRRRGHEKDAPPPSAPVAVTSRGRGSRRGRGLGSRRGRGLPGGVGGGDGGNSGGVGVGLAPPESDEPGGDVCVHSPAGTTDPRGLRGRGSCRGGRLRLSLPQQP